jgi:hypothetical protein
VRLEILGVKDNMRLNKWHSVPSLSLMLMRRKPRVLILEVARMLAFNWQLIIEP